MAKQKAIKGSAGEVGFQLRESYDRLLDSTRKTAEILNFDPWPQTGCSPKEIIWRKNKSKLYHYYSDKAPTHRIPVLFTYALINKAYILDLTPGMSMIEHLVGHGFDVYLLEWGDFEWEDRNLSYDDFVYDYIARAVQKVCQKTNSDELSIIGYCMGGTMTAMYASLFPKPKIRNFVLMASPIDFEDSGLTTKWLNTAFGDDVDKIVDTFELIPKEFVDVGLKMLRPVNNYIGTYSKLWKLVDEGKDYHSWKVLNKWVDDNMNFPGGAYRQWINQLYKQNRLVRGEFYLRGNRIDLGRIDSNLLALAGVNDHIVQPRQVNIALNVFSSKDKTYYEYPIGHGGLVFGKVAKEQVYPQLSEWLAARSD